MALIMFKYLDFFIRSRLDEQRNSCDVAYFDPVERIFRRINPAVGEVPKDHWLPLPIIREVDILRNFLRLTGRVSLLEKYTNLNAFDFCVKITTLADRYEFSHYLHGYKVCYCSEVISNWVEDNQIPNCKVILEPPLMEIATEEDMRKQIKIIGEKSAAEDLQEEEYKKSLHQ